MARQVSELQRFVNQFVKIVYLDGGKLSCVKGTLLSEDKDFLHLKGDFSNISISRTSVIKISSQGGDMS